MLNIIKKYIKFVYNNINKDLNVCYFTLLFISLIIISVKSRFFI